MSWVWYAIGTGLLSPSAVLPGYVTKVYREQGIVPAMGAWTGVAVLTIPLTVLAFWLVKTAFGL